jgi:hypothetical protein
MHVADVDATRVEIGASMRAGEGGGDEPGGGETAARPHHHDHREEAGAG